MQPERHEIEEALEIAARLVALYGDTFLPIFLRMEREMDAISEHNSARDCALARVGAAKTGNYNAINRNASARPASAPPSP